MRSQRLYFIRETAENSLTLFAMGGYIIAKRQPSMNQEAGSHQTLNLLVPWSWTSQPPELKNDFLLLPSLWYFVIVAKSMKTEIGIESEVLLQQIKKM